MNLSASITHKSCKKENNLKKKIFIAGQEGMVGSAILHIIKKNKSFNVINCNRKDLDLTNQSLVDKWFQKNKFIKFVRILIKKQNDGLFWN